MEDLQKRMEQAIEQRRLELVNECEKIAEVLLEYTWKGHGGCVEKQQFDDGETSWLQMLKKVMIDEYFHADYNPFSGGWADTIEMVAINGKLLTWEQAQTDEDMNKPFDYTFGGICGAPFTAWSAEWVYFPVQYDGAERIGRAPRNPCKHCNEHVGGG